MNILLVDDQATVLNGLRHGIDFEKLGTQTYLLPPTQKPR